MLGHFVLGLAGFSLGTAAVAQPVASRVSFDGVTAEYTRSIDDAGALHLEGRFIETSEPFHFVVAPDGHAKGAVAGRDVRFRVPRSVRHAAFGQSSASDATANDQIALAAELSPRR
jgi:hypothetical protein